MSQHCDTEFAPAQRELPEALAGIHEQLRGTHCVQVLDAVGSMVFVLEKHRQIVFANRTVREFLKVPAHRAILGERPGEALDCIHATKSEGGCGTTRWCRDCGAAKAILRGITGKRDVQECHMTRQLEGRTASMDLLVVCEPFELWNERFMVFTLSDISHEKRRAALERIFFHDILNLAGGMHSLVHEFAGQLPERYADLGEVLRDGLKRMVDEIVTQKELSAAESGELACTPIEMGTREILDSLAGLYRRHDITGDRAIVVAPDSQDLTLTTDATVLGRVVGNLLKNALEATPPGGTVTLGCAADGEDQVNIWVHNVGVMSPKVQRQVFSRSYSTKGSGRGLGTYAVQLLTAACLSGEAGFTSDEAEGTRFWLRLPRQWARPQAD